MSSLVVSGRTEACCFRQSSKSREEMKCRFGPSCAWRLPSGSDWGIRKTGGMASEAPWARGEARKGGARAVEREFVLLLRRVVRKPVELLEGEPIRTPMSRESTEESKRTRKC